jgi:hypothetical protein
MQNFVEIFIIINIIIVVRMWSLHNEAVFRL